MCYEIGIPRHYENYCFWGMTSGNTVDKQATSQSNQLPPSSRQRKKNHPIYPVEGGIKVI
jgi:hypothetical protein